MYKMDETRSKADSPVLKARRNRGPHGLGDPDDTFLRKVEEQVLIPKMIRERSRAEKCSEEVLAFAKCGKANGLAMVLNCRVENDLMKACLGKWFYDEEFREECKQKYLQERAEYRRTGLTKKERAAMANVETA
uniref:COX assembly mitochondrial protein n=1 Tax=Cuerna arida TaxID=1464854 RepID=A0A1B6G0H2_9HEMI